MTHDTKARPLIVAFLACLLVFQAGVLLANLSRLLAGDGDFSAYYRTAVMVRSGELDAMYDAAAQNRFDHQTFPALERYPAYYFYHPPYEALWLLPLSFLSYRAALWCWTAASIGLLLLAAHILEPEFQELRRAIGIPLLMVVLAFFPTMMIFLQGQDSAILLLLVALAFRLFERKQDYSCGILLGLGLFKFQFIIPLVALLAFRWRPRLIAAFLGTALSLLGLSWILVGSSGLMSYYQLLRHHTPEMAWRMPNIRGVVESLGGSPALIIALSLCVVLWCGLRVARSEAGAFATAIVCAELVSYHGHSYDGVLLLVPILWALNRAVLERSSLRAFWPALFFLMLPAYVLLARYNAWCVLAFPLLALAVAVSRPASLRCSVQKVAVGA
jgi:hypothetical protein